MDFFYPAVMRSDFDDLFDAAPFGMFWQQPTIRRTAAPETRERQVYRKHHQPQQQQQRASIEKPEQQQQQQQKVEKPRATPTKGVVEEQIPAAAKEESFFVPAADVTECDTQFVITMDMPGLKKDAIKVSLEDGILTVRGNRPVPSTVASAKNVLRREIVTGKMERMFELPRDVKPGDVYAKIEDGVLTITVKKPESAMPRKIEIA